MKKLFITTLILVVFTGGVLLQSLENTQGEKQLVKDLRSGIDQLPVERQDPTGTERSAYGEDDNDPITFSVEIPEIRAGELGGIITVYIDGEMIGKISNFHEDYDASIDIEGLNPGVHKYKLRVKVYTFKGYDPYYYKTVTGSGRINVEEYDTFMVASGASTPRLMKY